MKLKKDISLELKNELNLIRDTYIAVIENRQRPFTVDDIRNGIKPYQIVGLSEVPDLLSDSDEDIEKFVDEWFDKVVQFGVTEAVIKPRTPEQQALDIDMLDEATIKVILSYRQSDNRSKLKEKNYNLVKNYLLQNWSEGVKLTYIDDCMVKELGLSLRCVQGHRKTFFRENL